MSQSDIARFHSRHLPSRENNPEAAHHARKRIAELPDSYMAHAVPRKEDLIGEVQPSSPAAEQGRLHISSAPDAPKRRVQHAAAQPTIVEPPSPVVPRESNASMGAAVEKPVITSNPLEDSKITKTTQAEPVHGATEVKDAPANPHEPLKKRGLPSRLKPLLVGVTTFILLFTLFKAPIFVNQIGYLTSKPKTDGATATTASTVGAAPVISIPKINVNAPIVFATSNVEANIQKDLESGVVHYANTALPGNPGNSVIFGHSSNDWWEPGDYKFVFVLLDKLVVGDTFTVNYNSKQYMYKVVETKVVEPTDLSVLTQTPDPELTLITCTPPGTSWKRLIVRAQQISPAPQTADTTSPKQDVGINGALPGSAPSWTDSVSKLWHDFTGIFHSDS